MLTTRGCPTEPCDFEPFHKLEARLPEIAKSPSLWKHDFMFMGCALGHDRIVCFKHYHTRKTLLLDQLGNVYGSERREGDVLYFHIPDKEVLEHFHKICQF